MILGRGTAQTDEAIIEEYQQYVGTYSGATRSTTIKWMQFTPKGMLRDIGKPFAEWSDEDILHLCEGKSDTVKYTYRAFVLFLFHRGYRRATLSFLTAFHTYCTVIWRPALQPLRQKLTEAANELGQAQPEDVGVELRLLLWLLFTTGKLLEEVTRVDFAAFGDEYLRWYRQHGRKNKGTDPRLSRLEQLLIHMGIIQKAPQISTIEDGLDTLQTETFIGAVRLYLNWCDAKFKLKSVFARKSNLLYFFSWLQKHYPECQYLNEVTRPIALSYAQHLKELNRNGSIGIRHLRQRYGHIRHFYDFAIEEQLESAPSRNLFATGDIPSAPDTIPRYLPDQELRKILKYCEDRAPLIEKTVVTVLLHTGIRAAELAVLRVSDMVQVSGRWKLHIRLGKGLKDRVIPLTPLCVQVLQEWQRSRPKRRAKTIRGSDFFFSFNGKPWKDAGPVNRLVRIISRNAGVPGLTAHRFRHTFAVTLLNYGIRESVLQKLMGHETLNMTLEYARILDESVEKGFTEAVEQMQDGPLNWVPNFFEQEDYTIFAEGDSVSWIQLPVGFCRRNPKLHCESDVKCFLCERFWGTAQDLPRLRLMQERFLKLGLNLKADVVAAQIQQIEERAERGTFDEAGLSQAFIPLAAVTSMIRR